MIECKCGCGQQLEKYDRYGRERKYLHGHNRTKKNPKDVIRDNVKMDNDCWIWQGYKQTSGHGQLVYRSKSYGAHRFSYKVFNGDIAGKYVCHKCDNPSCVNPDHLYLGTPHDNIKDVVFRYRHPALKMIHTDEKITKIRELYETGKYKQADLVKMFSVEQSLISRWVRYRKRPYADCEINPTCFSGGE